MNPVQIIQSLFQQASPQNTSLLSLKPGQLLYGRVEKYMSDDTAVIRIGEMRFIATIKANLSVAENYLFEVRAGDKGGVELKVVEELRNEVSAQLLLKNFQLPETKQTLQLVQFLLSKNIPVLRDQLRLAASWITGHTDPQKAFTAVEWMITKDLPFTNITFQSLVAVQDSQSLYQQLDSLRSELEHPAFASLNSAQSMKEMISTILQNRPIDDLSRADDVKQLLKQLVKSLGLNYESEVGLMPIQNKTGREQLQSLKQLVLTLMADIGSQSKQLEPLLNRLTGMQLISQDFNSPMQQIVMQLPWAFGEMKSDITLQWNGRKTNNGQIDPNYCRILFYLDLQSLKQTVVDMQVQNRVIHLTIMNDHNGVEAIVKALTPTLKENLESVGYTLSFIEVNPCSKKTKEIQRNENPITSIMATYQRVDKRV